MRENEAFERQLRREVDHQAGPRTPVDAMAITRAAHAPKWRIQRMFNSTSFIAAGSITAAALALLLIAQPLGQVEPEPVPAAEQAVAVPVAFSGMTGPDFDGDLMDASEGVYEHGSPLRTTRDSFITVLTSEFTDPRMNGTMTLSTNLDEYWAPGQLSGIETIAIRIANDDGAWEGSAVSALVPFEDRYRPSTYTIVLRGEGGYEGLVAVMEADENDDFTMGTGFEGLILEGELPPFADPAAVD